MKFAIQSPGNGPIHSIGKSVGELKEYLRRNPTSNLVKRAKGQWKLVPFKEIFPS